MKPVILATVMAALLLGSPVLLAQTTQGNVATDTAAPSQSGRPAGNTHTHAVSGNDNQALAMTSAYAPAPATGANSFTMGEAKSRIESDGFTNVSGLSKDDNGVWHGSAQKSGNTTTVWLDYKGNVGAGQ